MCHLLTRSPSRATRATTEPTWWQVFWKSHWTPWRPKTVHCISITMSRSQIYHRCKLPCYAYRSHCPPSVSLYFCLDLPIYLAIFASLSLSLSIYVMGFQNYRMRLAYGTASLGEIMCHDIGSYLYEFSSSCDVFVCCIYIYIKVSGCPTASTHPARAPTAKRAKLIASWQMRASSSQRVRWHRTKHVMVDDATLAIGIIDVMFHDVAVHDIADLE